MNYNRTRNKKGFFSNNSKRDPASNAEESSNPDNKLGVQIAEKIEKILKTKKISVYRLCECTNLPRSSFSQIKSGRFNFRIEHLKDIASFLRISIDELVFGESKENLKLNYIKSKREMEPIYVKLLNDYTKDY